MKTIIFIFQFIQNAINNLLYKYIFDRRKASKEEILNIVFFNKLSIRLYKWKFFHCFMKKNSRIPFFDKETSRNTRVVFLLSFICLIIAYAIITIVVLILVILSLNLMIFILNLSSSDNTEKAVALLSALGTMGAAIFAARSAMEVSLSNKLIKENNVNEDFYRKFSILLDKHDNYLSLINDFFKKEISITFKIEYLSTLSCDNALKIIRGINSEVYASAERDENKEIAEGNSFAKNVLSPYMRILYHTLKSIDFHFSNDKNSREGDAKQYSNIIRSLIPNDLLFLVALNSVIFYNQRGDKRKYKDLININSGKLNIYNDYHKFFQLLIRYDFFEHLNIINNDECKQSGITKFDMRNFDIHDNIYSVNLSRRNFYVIVKSGEYHLESLIKKITSELKKLSSLEVIGLFYFYDDNRKLAKNISETIVKKLEELIDSKIKECSSELELHENTPQLRYNSIDDFINYFDLSKIKTEIEFGVINPKEEIIVIDERYFFSNLLSGSLVNISR
ncbi:hypothetical protein BVY06_14480 [Pectobacterium odoriferum]|nr:hypothetical protein KS43_21720 [Pectobacterium odoriferum]POD94431.1 hypothetical protein BVY06_14480 [Pectobacterium odoriferum]